MSTQLAAGSIGDLAQRNNQSIAESFLCCDCVVLIDVSGSMEAEDGTGKTRFERACEALKDLQASLPGKFAVVSFSDGVNFEPSGVPLFKGGGTDLAGALRFVKMADVPDMRFVVVSDGVPDDRQRAIWTARSFLNRIDVIFIGNELDGAAIRFMSELARVSGGEQITADSAGISANVRFLLNC